MAQVNPEIALPVQIVIRIVWACDVQLTQFHEAANPLPLRRRRLHKRPFLTQLSQIRHLLSRLQLITAPQEFSGSSVSADVRRTCAG